MKKYTRIDYTKVELPEELLTFFAKELAPEIRKFYDSDEGKAYFEKWLTKHPEYDERTPDATARASEFSHIRQKIKEDYNYV